MMDRYSIQIRSSLVDTNARILESGWAIQILRDSGGKIQLRWNTYQESGFLWHSVIGLIENHKLSHSFLDHFQFQILLIGSYACWNLLIKIPVCSPPSSYVQTLTSLLVIQELIPLGKLVAG